MAGSNENSGRGFRMDSRLGKGILLGMLPGEGQTHSRGRLHPEPPKPRILGTPAAVPLKPIFVVFPKTLAGCANLQQTRCPFVTQTQPPNPLQWTRNFPCRKKCSGCCFSSWAWSWTSPSQFCGVLSSRSRCWCSAGGSPTAAAGLSSPGPLALRTIGMPRNPRCYSAQC